MEEIEIDYAALEETLNALFSGDAPIGFYDLVQMLMRGELSVHTFRTMLLGAWKSQIFYGTDSIFKVVLFAVLLRIISGLLYEKERDAVKESCFYVVYLYVVSGLVALFQTSAGITLTMLQNCITFVKTLIPSLCACMVCANGSASAAGTYASAMLGCTVVWKLYANIVVPDIRLCFLLGACNRFLGRDKLSKLAKLFAAFAQLLIRLGMTSVLLLSGMKGILTRDVDSVRRSVLIRSAGAVPVVGNLLGESAELVLAACRLTKNAVGIAGSIFLLLLGAMPFLQLGTMYFLLRTAAAVIQPIADERITDCLEVCASAHKLLFQTMVGAVVLFLALILLTTGMFGGETSWS